MSSSRKPDEPALVTALFSRRLAEPFARLAVRLGISADAITVAGGLCWMASLALAPLAGEMASPWLWAACAALWCLGYWLDVVDGSVARLAGTSSRAGFFLDCVFHLLFKPAFLFSVGLGLALQEPRTEGLSADILLFVLAVLSLPANGAAATSAAELALCEEVALGRLRPDGAASPALWLGAADVAAPAAEKCGTPLRAAKTLAQETLSYYLQAPFFALLVCADLALRAVPRGILGDIETFAIWHAGSSGGWLLSLEMPFTSIGLALLSLALFLRIPLRLARESRRLGRPTRAGRGGRALARLSALCAALGAAGIAAWPATSESEAALRAPCGRLPLLVLYFAPPALLLLGAALRALAARATRRAGTPVHNRYLLRAFDLLLAPTVVGALALRLAAEAGPGLSEPVPPFLVVLCLAPLAAVACRPVASETLAHVLCQETGKGRLRPGDPAPWDAPAPRLAALVPLLPALVLPAEMGFLAAAGFVLLSLALLLSLPRRLRAVRRALA